MEDDLQWKTNFGGRRPLMEGELRWKTTFGGRQPSVEDNFQGKMTFGGRRPSVEDDLWWKTTCSGRRPSAEDDVCLLPTPLSGIFELSFHISVALYRDLKALIEVPKLFEMSYFMDQSFAHIMISSGSQRFTNSKIVRTSGGSQSEGLALSP